MRSLRGSILLVVGVLIAAACQSEGTPTGTTGDGLTLAADKVWVCHFPGHVEKPEGAFSDYRGGPPGFGQCSFGGNAIEVSRQACVNGHGVAEASCYAP
jgi:hypothetical protein